MERRPVTTPIRERQLFPESSQRPPALLLNPNYYGTLAAVRCLGRRDIPVVVAGPERFAFSSWSRFAGRRLVAPSPDDPEHLLEWLVRFGEAEPGHVLYPTSDDVAWLVAAHRDRLEPHFRLFQPPSSVLRSLLDKRALHDLCSAVGLLTPHTFFPRSDADLREIAKSARFPLLIKPITQVGFRTHAKGEGLTDASRLVERYYAFRAINEVRPVPGGMVQDSAWPMLQQMHAEARTAIYTLAGFVTRDGRVKALASRKVLQRPRTLGIGLGFEAAALDATLLEGVAALCRAAGYFGAFEVEFIETAGGMLLIDFNPRFYSQMEFEVCRGLPLPLIAYEAALGRDDAFNANGLPSPGRSVYSHGLLFELLVRGQLVTGRMSVHEGRRWRTWRREHRGDAVDAVSDEDDPLPRLFDTLRIVRQMATQPRSFARQYWLEQ